ncbi:MAG: hypothetical protein LR015_08290 [Verrucomicrobia bacterium]|nr:hypothetical protein [Verrucomicrobiota bacterium]
MARGGQWNEPVKPGAFALVCIAVGMVLHLLAINLANWQLPSVKDSPPAQQTTYTLITDRTLLSELFDSAPLFLPTAVNFSATLSGIASLTEELEVFAPHAPMLAGRSALREQRAGLDQDASTSLDLYATLLRAQPAWRPLSLVANANVGDPELPRFRFFSLASPLAQALEQSVSTALAQVVPNDLWSPAEWWFQVEPTGVVGQPLPTAGTGHPAFDEAIRQEILTRSHLWNLPPGYYRVVLTPP